MSIVGIPYRLVKEAEGEEPVDKTIYLSTRRFGDAGKAMKKAKRAYNKYQVQCVAATKRYESLDRRVQELPVDSPNMQELEDERDKFLLRVDELGDLAAEEAEKLVLLSLTENYGKANAQDILDQVTSVQLHQMVTVIETGEQPSDFSESDAAQQKQTTIQPSGGSQQKSSSKTGTQAKTSRKAK